MQAYDSASFSQALAKFNPTGWTPLADAIEAAGKDLQKGSQKNARNVVYVVSDGEETCGGDPVKAGKELKKSGIEPMVHIVGFDVEDQGQKQLMEVAEAADGNYKDVYTESDLKSYLEAERERMKMEWANWSTKSQNDIYDNWAKKYREMEDIIFNKGLAVIKNREIERMYKARSYLEKKGKVPVEELGRKVSDRDHLIRIFLSDKRSEITADLDKKEKEAIKATEEKEKKMKGQYE